MRSDLQLVLMASRLSIPEIAAAVPALAAATPSHAAHPPVTTEVTSAGQDGQAEAMATATSAHLSQCLQESSPSSRV